MRRLKEQRDRSESDILFLGGGRRGGRTALGIALAPRPPSGVVRRRRQRPERRRHQRDGASRRPLLGDRDGPGRLRARRARGADDARRSRRSHAKWYPSLDGPAVEPHPHVVLGSTCWPTTSRSPLTDPLRHLDRVRQDPAELAILPDRYGAFLEARIKWIGPYRLPPDKPTGFRVVRPDLRCLRAWIRGPSWRRSSAVARGVCASSRTAYGGPAGRQPVSDAVHGHPEDASPRPLLPGVPFGPMPTFGGYTTSILFRQRGFPTYGYSPIAMNITDSVRGTATTSGSSCGTTSSACEIYADALEEFATFNAGDRNVSRSRRKVTICATADFGSSIPNH